MIASPLRHSLWQPAGNGRLDTNAMFLDIMMELQSSYLDSVGNGYVHGVFMGHNLDL
jgi:hypothetical protein